MLKGILVGEVAERRGAVGCFRANFGRDGRDFSSTWVDNQKHLNTRAFKKEFDSVINFLRNNGQEPPFASRKSLEMFCHTNPDKELAAHNCWYMVRTENYSYYFGFKPHSGDSEIYCYAFDNRYLLPELAGKHELPKKCFSTLPSNGKRILLWRGQSGYDSFDSGVENRAAVRVEVDKDNARWGVTRAQEEAMLAGSMFGWDTPAAKPWRYDQDGRPKTTPPKRKEPER